MGFDNVNVNVSGPVQPTSTYKTKVLKGNHSFASQVTDPNTIYVIKYDFDLESNTVEIPSGCLIKFDGGSVSNGTLVGNDTAIEAGLTKIFGKEVTLDGTWNVKEGYPQWYGIYPNDNSKDVTPVIKKYVAVSIPIFFSSGIWYLSECLLNGKNNVNIKGVGTHYKTGTTFKAFNSTGQRFILKLGGLATFNKPSNYNSVWCSNFILDGINFDTYDTTFINADPENVAQNYAALCLDWCVEGYVNMRHMGACPALFIANTWEVYFESIVCYGSHTKLNESAIYLGKAYTDIEASDISAVTINNLFGEDIYGKFVDCHSSPNVADLIINNVEFEPYSGNSAHVSHERESAYSIIENNIRNMEYLYYFNFSGHEVHIHSMTCCIYPVTYNNDTIARGLVKAFNGATNVIIDNIISVDELYVTIILGAEYYSMIRIGNINTQRYSRNISIYTDVDRISDFTNIINSLPYVPGIVTIENTTAVIDKDIIKYCNPGLLINSKNEGELSTFEWENHKIVPVTGLIDGRSIDLIFFNQIGISKKFKFEGNRLTIKYTQPNKWETENIIFTYYKSGNIVNTDKVKLTYSDSEILTYQYDIYSDKYDYCTIMFKSSMFVESIYLENIEQNKEQKVVAFGSEISDDVIQIMNNYIRDDVYKRTALQYFFNTIGNIRSKLNHIILPVFASNLNEALYDIVTGNLFTNIDGNNYLEFNKDTRRLHMSIEVTSSNWRDGLYSLYDDSEPFEGAITVLSATNGNGYGNINFYDNCFVELNNASLGYFAPLTTDNKKIIGCGIVSYNGAKYLIRLADTGVGDNLTSVEEMIGVWRNTCQIFGQKPSDNTKGVRILVSTDKLITIDEAKLLRDAVIELDNKFAVLDTVNDNFIPIMEKLIIPNSGTWNDKPSSADIPVGFAYFCTDKQTTEGAADGITIYYKEQDTTDPDNPVDVWVDALGRVIS